MRGEIVREKICFSIKNKLNDQRIADSKPSFIENTKIIS